MKKWIAAALCLMMLLGAQASASNFYLIKDSNTRLLTREELWTWSYDALGYVFNEIFARHGYHFEPGGKYESYFEAQEWYEENERYATNQEIYKYLMTDIEWKNERLCKDVRAEMRALGTRNEKGKKLPAVFYEPEIPGAFSSFEEIRIGGGKKLSVYSGPGKQYYRGANGKAMASSNGKLYACGWEDGWLMLMYWTNGGSVRVGYAPQKEVGARVNLPELGFAFAEEEILSACALTDDPVMSNQKIVSLKPGMTVTYLSEFVNHQRWAYIETYVSGTPVRGFIPADCVTHIEFDEEMDWE